MPAGKNNRFAAFPHEGHGAAGRSRIVCQTSNSVEQLGQRYP
jgi:hypothetical protein